MNNNPALSGGLLKSRPTWSNAFGCSATSVFLFLVTRDVRNQGESGSGSNGSCWQKGKPPLIRKSIGTKRFLALVLIAALGVKVVTGGGTKP